MPLKTKSNFFGRECPGTPDPEDPNCPECNQGQTEFCCRACWIDNCPCDWDLWMRDRNEGAGQNWVSYLDLGPVGEMKFELNEDVEKPSNNDFCGDIVSPCGLTPIQNGYAGEMACACMDANMTFPKIFDIITNFFGADPLDCPPYLNTLCVQCFCNGVAMYESYISGTPSTSGAALDGNYGQSLIRHPAVKFDAPCCDCWTQYWTSVCWSFSAKRADGSLYVTRGPGRAPSRFIIADDVDESSVTLYEDGVFIPRQAYEVLHESVAEKAKKIIGELGIKGKTCCGDKNKRRKPKSLF